MAPVPVNGEKNRLFGENPSRIRAVASEHLAMGPGAGRRVKHRPRAAGEVTGVGIELPTTGGGAGTRISPRGDCAPGLWLANITLTSILPIF